jgi:hypothetical protein
MKFYVELTGEIVYVDMARDKFTFQNLLKCRRAHRKRNEALRLTLS